MERFMFGYKKIDDKISFSDNDFIVLAGPAGIGHDIFALNVLYRSNRKGCYIALYKSKQYIEYRLNKIEKSYNIVSKLETLISEKIIKSDFEVKIIELPKVFDIIEFIVLNKNKFDYFIIDSLQDIMINNSFADVLFNKCRNYDFILRHLKLLCIALNKNIILTSDTFNIGDNESWMSNIHYKKRERHIDYLGIIHRPDYYRKLLSDEDFENFLEEDYKTLDASLCFIKTKNDLSIPNFELTCSPINFTFNSKIL